MRGKCALYRSQGSNYDFWSSVNKAPSSFIPLYAVVLYILLLNYSMASAGAIIIGQITPAGLSGAGILGITFDREVNPLVLDGSGKTIWRLDLHDASVISTFPTPTLPGIAQGLEFDVVTGRFFTSAQHLAAGQNLFAVDPFSGLVTNLGFMGRFNFWDLAIDPIAGDLWLINDCGNIECTEGGGTLGTVNKLTGEVTAVHIFGRSLGQLIALAISPQGRFFVASFTDGFSRIYEIDPLSGESTFITETGLGRLSLLMDMAFDPSTNRLYGTEERRGVEPRAWYLVEVTGLPPLEISVVIDIKPGSSSNKIDLRSKIVIPVAILTTNTFDATTVHPLSVEFGPNGATEAHGKGHIEDVNKDGRKDLMLHFNTQETGIQCRQTSASLTGETFDGDEIEGSDSIQTVGCP